MLELTDDEVTCLTIMVGDAEHPPTNMLAIGRWQKTLEDLAAKNFASRLDGVNYVSTKAGAKALAEVDLDQTSTMAGVVNEIKQTKEEAATLLETAAKSLAEACHKHHRLTGAVPNQVTWEMGQNIIKRALELLK